MSGRFSKIVWRFLGGVVYQRDFRQLQAVTRSIVAQTGAPVPEEPGGFEDYVHFYQLSGSDLCRLRRQHVVRFYFMAGCALFASTFGLTATLSTFGWTLGLLTVLLASLFTAIAARHSLRAWQIRERRLGSLREWLNRPRVWLPPLSTE